MAGWLTNEVKREVKLARLQELGSEIRRELTDNLLGHWYLVSEKEQPQERLRIATALLKALQARTSVHGELLERLLPEREAAPAFSATCTCGCCSGCRTCAHGRRSLWHRYAYRFVK